MHFDNALNFKKKRPLLQLIRCAFVFYVSAVVRLCSFVVLFCLFYIFFSFYDNNEFLRRVFYSVLLFPADGGGVCFARGGTGVGDGPVAEGKGASGQTQGKDS